MPFDATHRIDLSEVFVEMEKDTEARNGRNTFISSTAYGYNRLQYFFVQHCLALAKNFNVKRMSSSNMNQLDAARQKLDEKIRRNRLENVIVSFVLTFPRCSQ